MKKTICLLLTILLMAALSACGEPPTVQSDFTAVFTVKEGDTDYAGVIEKENDSVKITMTAPYTVEGIQFCYEGSGLSVCCASHSTEANADYLPENSIPSVLHNSLAYLAQANYTATENGEDSFTLPTPYGDALLTAKDGFPLSLTVEHSGMTFDFSP